MRHHCNKKYQKNKEIHRVDYFLQLFFFTLCFFYNVVLVFFFFVSVKKIYLESLHFITRDGRGQIIIGEQVFFYYFTCIQRLSRVVRSVVGGLDVFFPLSELRLCISYIFLHCFYFFLFFFSDWAMSVWWAGRDTKRNILKQKKHRKWSRFKMSENSDTTSFWHKNNISHTK